MQTLATETAQQIGAKWILKFLRYKRCNNNPLTLHELKNTQTFQRCSVEEQEALRFAVEHTPRHAAIPTPHDRDLTKQRDSYLMYFAAGASDAVLNQRRNWAGEIQRIRFDIQREAGELTFAWIWEKRL